MQLEDIFKKAVDSIDEDALVEKIKKQMEATICSQIESSFSPWSKAGKLLEERISQEAIGIVGKIDIEQYFHNIAGFASSELQNSINESAKKHLKTTIGVITEKAPESMKLSELVEITKQEVVSQSSLSDIELDVEYQNDIRVRIEISDSDADTRIVLSSIGSDVLDKSKALDVIVHSGLPDQPYRIHYGDLNKALFWMQFCGTKLIIDENDCDTEYEREECYC